MAQTGYTPIQLYSSSTTGNAPAAADLLNSSGGSELAINIFDGKLFYKDSAGAVQVIGWKIVPTTAGGTGQTSYTDGQLLIGNSTGNTLTKATLTAGSGVSITNGAGSITISATGGTGTVTSVSGTSPISVATGTTTPVISISQAGAAANGYLSSTDWNTFNNKGSGTVTSVSGTGTVNGLTLTGTVTSTGSLTLGGTLDLSSPPAIGGTTAAAITGTTITANTKFVSSYFDASGSGGGSLRNASGTALIQWGGGGGTNITISGATNINPASQQVDISPTGTGKVNIHPVGGLDISPTAVGTMDNVTIGSVTPKAITGTTITATTFSGSGASLTSIPNSALTNSTISGVALGGSLFNLTAGTGVTFSTGTTYNGSAAITINATGTGGTVTSVTGTAPVAVATGTTTPVISMAKATGSVDGYLSSTDWTTFNNKSNTNGTVTSVAALTLGTSGTDLSSTVANGTTTPVITLNVPTASATNRGALSSTDWSTFNGKQAALVSGTNIKTVGGVSLLGSGDVGTIGTGYGGTGLSSFTSGGLVYASSTSALTTGSTIQTDGSRFSINGALQSGVSLYIATSGDNKVRSDSGATNACYHVFVNTTVSTVGTENSSGGSLVAGSSPYATILSNNGAYPVQIGANNTVRATFFSSGGVSIGNTTDPGATNLSVTGAVTGATFSSTSGTYVNAPNATAVTLTTLPNVASGTWIVNAALQASSAPSWSAVYIVTTQGTSTAVTLLKAATGTLTVSMSGLNLQATQTSTFSYSIVWSILRLF